MSILIKDVEMPTCCDKCFASDNHGGYPHCLITDEWCGYKFRTREKRMDKCPLIGIEPVRHGKWIEEPNCYYRCSKCRVHYPSIKGYMDYNYCPHCGAKMDGERREE